MIHTAFSVDQPFLMFALRSSASLSQSTGMSSEKVMGMEKYRVMKRWARKRVGLSSWAAGVVDTDVPAVGVGLDERACLRFAQHKYLPDPDLERAFFTTHPSLRALVLDTAIPPPPPPADDNNNEDAIDDDYIQPPPDDGDRSTDAIRGGSGSASNPPASSPPALNFQHILPAASGAIVGTRFAFSVDKDAPMLTPTYDLLSTAPRGAVRVASSPLPGSPHVSMDLLTGASAGGSPTLVAGVNGHGDWAVAGILRIRNEGKRACRLQRVSVVLDVEFSGFTVSHRNVGAGRRAMKQQQQAGVLVPFRFKIFDAPPVVLVENVDVAPNEDFYASFRFPFTTAGPPSLDLTASIAHPTATAVTYRLVASAHDAKPTTLLSPSSSSSRRQALLTHTIPVPPPTTQAATAVAAAAAVEATFAPALRGAALAIRGLAWWARLATPTAPPGGEVQVQIAVDADEAVMFVAMVEVSLIEFVAAPGAGGGGGGGGEARATSHVARSVTVPRHLLRWAAVPGGGSENGDEANPWRRCPPTVRLVTVSLRVPAHSSTPRASGHGPTVDGASVEPPKAGGAPPPLPRLGKVVSPCVNYDGRWNGVVVAHEVVCKLTVEQTATGFTDWVEAVVPVAVAAASREEDGALAEGAELPQY
ncbi:hypothetical protein DFJ73DRAFT_774435 [Zopfochytrium polystomum]|nr:hypothetical protein DFJ73DRAFT_774435 [Zopfochytrium polystomum]